MSSHKTLIEEGKKGWRWVCFCGTAGAYAPEPTETLFAKAKAHEDKFNEGDLP